MTKVVRTHQILVHAPLQSVFDYVADLTRHPEWSSGQLTIEATQPGPIAVGKEYLSRGEAAGQKNRPNRVRISEYEPPHRFGFVADDPAIKNISHVFTFIEQEGGVLVRRVMTLPLHPMAALVFRFLVYPLVGSPAMDKSLALLKAELEQKH
jgi:uncharacterized protein YndB with AHSA1/START domain